MPSSSHVSSHSAPVMSAMRCLISLLVSSRNPLVSKKAVYNLMLPPEGVLLFINMEHKHKVTTAANSKSR